MKKILISLIITCLFCINVFSLDIADIAKCHESERQLYTLEKFKKIYGPASLYKWKSYSKSLTYSSTKNKSKLSFSKQKISYAIFKFKDNQLCNATIYLNNFNKKNFKECSKVADLIKQSIDKSFKSLAPNKWIKSGAWQKCMWRNNGVYAELKWRLFKTNKTARICILLKLDPKLDKPKITESDPELDCKKLIKLNVPVYLETKRSKCLIGNMRMLYKYYKVKTERRHWEKLAKRVIIYTDAMRRLKTLLVVIEKRCKCKAQLLTACTIFDDNVRLFSFINLYNSIASKENKSGFPISISSNTFKHISNTDILQQADKDILLKTRIQEKEYKEFKEKVIKELKNKNPVLWFMVLGVVDEKISPVFRKGNYCRIIVGYDPATDEFLYSDCWGKKHLAKRISTDKAWTATLLTAKITPNKDLKRF